MSRRAKILIVDDNEAGRYVKRRILEQAGYEIDEAHEGFEALRTIVVAKPDLVMLDVGLPDISGIEICRKLRENQANIAVLMTSAAFVDPLDRAAALESGADSYLIEPIDPNELVASVRALLRMGKAEHDLRVMNDTLAHKVAERTRELAEVAGNLEIEKQNVARGEEALWHTQRLDAIGRLTGGIAHDFNNLLTVVLGNFEIVEHELQRMPGAEKLLRYVRSGHRAANDCAGIIRQLLVFARRDGRHLSPTDLNKSIARMEDFIRRSLGEQVQLDLELNAGGATCNIDPAHFEAALLNLAINARDAMPEGGKLRIVAELVTVAGGRAHGGDGMPLPADIIDGDYVAVLVADTGMGMAPDIVTHVFEPFFTTKDIGKGSGLGLSQVFGFVKQSNGYIAIDTAPGEGARFGIFLPRFDDEPVVHAEAPRSLVELPRGNGTILVVEDNGLVLDYVTTTASGLGYRVLQATNGNEALDVTERDEKINLLFTDLVMPNGMSGIELAREVRQRRPDIKVLITSGYSGRIEGERNGSEFMSIVKPYSTEELAKRLHEALAG